MITTWMHNYSLSILPIPFPLPSLFSASVSLPASFLSFPMRLVSAEVVLGSTGWSRSGQQLCHIYFAGMQGGGFTMKSLTDIFCRSGTHSAMSGEDTGCVEAPSCCGNASDRSFPLAI